MTIGKPSSAAVPLKARRERYRQEIIEAILDAARAVMREQGVAGLNVNEVARRVGMSSQALSRYFPSKAALYDALFRLGCRLYWERLQQVLVDYAPSWERLQVWIETRLAFAHEYPELDSLILSREVPGFVPSPQSMQEVSAMLDRALQSWMEMREAGIIDPSVSPARSLHLFLAMMHGLVTLHMANEPDLPPGTGRFGSLVPDAMALFRIAWIAHVHQSEES